MLWSRGSCRESSWRAGQGGGDPDDGHDDDDDHDHDDDHHHDESPPRLGGGDHEDGNSYQM